MLGWYTSMLHSKFLELFLHSHTQRRNAILREECTYVLQVFRLAAISECCFSSDSTQIVRAESCELPLDTASSAHAKPKLTEVPEKIFPASKTLTYFACAKGKWQR